MTSPDPEYLTAAEAAAVLRVNKRTVYRMIRAGRLAAFPAGRPVRIHRSAVAPTKPEGAARDADTAPLPRSNYVREAVA